MSDHPSPASRARTSTPAQGARSLVTIEPDGLVTVSREAAQRLAEHAGPYRLAPTTGDLVILQRIAPEAAAREQSALMPALGRVALAGEIDSVGGVVDIINFIHGNGWSGNLAIVDDALRKNVYFRRGDIRSAASNVPEDRLGAILYRYGLVTEEALGEALRDAGPGKASRLGQVLVERGILSPHDLYTYVRKQVEEIFFGVLSLRKGSFYFYRTGDDDGPSSQLQLSTQALLFDGVRRIDEMAYFREKLPGPDVVVCAKPSPPALDKLGPPEQRLFELIDGSRDLGTLSRLSRLGEFETTKILYQLIQSGFVEPRKAPAVKLEASRPGDSIDDIYGRVIDTFNGVFLKIFAALKARGREQALSTGIDSFFGSVADYAPLFVGLALDSDGAVPREQLISNLMMAPVQNKLDYLHRGLNELLFFELFTAGEAVDRREEIELHQRLDEIMRAQRPSREEG